MPTRSNKLLVGVSFALVFCPYGARAQHLSAADILRKVSERYRQVSTFSLVAENEVELVMDSNGRRHNSYNPEPSNTFYAMGPFRSEYIQVRLMALGWSKANLLLKDGKKEVAVINDGERISTLIPSRQAYTEVSATSVAIQPVDIFRVGNSNISGVGLLVKYEWLFVMRFQSISTYGRWARLRKYKVLKVGKARRRCYVLEIHVPGSLQKERLWVDKKEFIVWKSVDTNGEPEDLLGDRLQTNVIVRMKQLTLNPSLAESNFAFTQPDQATRVDTLTLLGKNPF
jgi:outer membrane lipoprotein-sorting protein